MGWWAFQKASAHPLGPTIEGRGGHGNLIQNMSCGAGHIPCPAAHFEQPKQAQEKSQN